MGTTYTLRVVRVDAADQLAALDGPDARVSIKGSVLFAVIDGILSRRYRGAWKRSPYRWFYEAYGLCVTWSSSVASRSTRIFIPSRARTVPTWRPGSCTSVFASPRSNHPQRTSAA